MKIAFALLALAFLTASRLLAFDTDSYRWTLNRTVVMHLSLGPDQALSDGFTSFNRSAQDALALWNQHLVHLKFAPVLNSTAPKIDGDADNSVFFSDTIYGEAFDDRTLAVTLISPRDSSTPTSTFPEVLGETDVIFNGNETWDSYRGGQQAAAYDFHRVALHEFGHVLGLDHPDEASPAQSVAAIMNSRASAIDSLKADDISGARFLYDDGPAFLSTAPAPVLVNLSTRAFIGTGGSVLIGGFIIQGPEPATVILRAIGHSLAARGISNALTDPMITLYDSSGAAIATDDDWVQGADAEKIASYQLDPANSRESAIFKTLPPGNYTAIVESFPIDDGPLTGTGLVELYDLQTTGGRAANISTRGEVLAGDNILIGGFIVGSGPAKEVVVRGIGPSLADAGLANALGDPTLQLINAAGTVVSSNDDWEEGPDAAAIQNRGLAPAQPAESALRAVLRSGSYTALLRGVNNTTGIALVEVYDLSPAPN